MTTIRKARKKRRLDAAPGNFPSAIERQYRRELERRVRVIGRVAHDAIGEMLAIRGAEIDDLARQDSEEEVVKAIIREIAGIRIAIEGIWTERETRDLATDIGKQVDNFTTRQTARQWSSVMGIDPLFGDAATQKIIREFSLENLRLIKDMPDKFLTQVQDELVEAVRTGTRAEVFQDLVQERLGVAESRAKLIARDQIGSMNGRIAERRQRELGVSRFIWSTSMDERVRELHRDREGEEFTWDHDFNESPDDGPPGRPIQCRCIADPVIDDLL